MSFRHSAPGLPSTPRRKTSDMGRKMCRWGRAAADSASSTASTSWGVALASAAIMGPRTSRAIWPRASRSSAEAAG